MFISELSTRSGVPVPTIKFYLREGLLPPGESVSATRSRYDDAHLRRLRLIRALVEVGGVSLATVRAVLDRADDARVPVHDRLGAVTSALGAEGEEPLDLDDPPTAAVTARVDALLSSLGWNTTHLRDHPAGRQLVRALLALERIGWPATEEDLRRYAEAARALAAEDVARVDQGDPAGTVEYAVVGTVLYEPVLLALRRLAHSEESARRFGRDCR